MKLMEPAAKPLYETNKDFEDTHLKLLFPSKNIPTKEEVIYRNNGKSVNKVVEFNAKTGSKLKITHYDYFDDKKIRSIDEFDEKTGKKIRTINYVLYKSIDEYDIETGEKIRTINFNVKDDSKISSIQEYDIKSGKIVKVSIYKRDGRSVSIIKNIDPLTDEVTNTFNKTVINKPTDNVSIYTRSYDNYKKTEKKPKEDVAKLIDNLYKNNLKFENI